MSKKNECGLSDEELGKSLTAAKTNLEAIRGELHKLEEKCHKQYDWVKKLGEEEWNRRWEKSRVSGDTAQIYSMLLDYDLTNEVGYKTRQEYFYMHMRGINSRGVVECADGTHQRSIQIALTKGNLSIRKNKDQYDAVVELLPYMKAVKSCDNELVGAKYIDILERTCSEHGSYSLYAMPDGTAKLSLMRYYRRTLTSFPSLEAAFNYISANVWDDGETDDNEDDEE